MPQQLPPRERALFAQVVKNYENKYYKKGVKAADQILRKHPGHGETQAMKALILNSQGQAEEAFALGKTALTSDMKSPICWHVYGLLYRAAKNYEEAIKAYKFALRLDPESPQIQRDLALLQIHMRDYAGAVQSRMTMLQARSSIRMNWSALAVAQHLSGELAAAERVLTTYEDSLKTPPAKNDIEHQEAILYKNTIIAEMGETERALDHLNAATKGSFDRQSVMEMRAAYLLQLGRKPEAAKAYRKLLNRNAENREYYQGLQRALDIEDSDVEGLRKMYLEYAEKAPGADTPRRVPLEFLQGDDFKTAVDEYLQRMLKKGAPSTFANVKELYTNTEKRDIIQALAEGYAASLPESPPSETAEDKKEGENARYELAVLYFLAQHYNYHRSRDLAKATQLVERVLARQPNNTDFHMTKARILKHAGDVPAAAAAMDHARTLDTRDRYINTKAAKYQLRAGAPTQALTLLAMFTRPDAPGGAAADLVDMQAVWFLLADAAAARAPGRLGRTLRRAAQARAVFDTWTEDQFDFHSFALRKGQVRAYVAMLRWQDALRAHPYFVRMALGAVRAYLRLHDDPRLARGGGDEALANGVHGDGESKASRKKAAQKARKAARERERAEQAEAEKRDAKKTAGGAAAAEPEAKKVEKDPEGTELLATEEPLKEAMQYLDPLLEFSPQSVEAQAAGFEVFIRRKKYLLALRCLLATHALAPASPARHAQLYRLHHALAALPEPLPPPVAAVFKSDFEPLLPSPPSAVDITAANQAFLAARDPGDLQALLAVLGVRRDVEGDAGAWRNEAAGLLADALKHAGEGLGWEEAEEVLFWLREHGLDAAPLVAAARERWPQATAFQDGKSSAET